MNQSTRFDPTGTLHVDGGESQSKKRLEELRQRYEILLHERRLNWTTHMRLKRRLGEGGQGVVYLTERRGADGFTLPIALKIFSPERFPTPTAYDEAMIRVARVASLVASIHHDNLLDVHNFVDRDRIRIMEMEWVEGFDLRQILRNRLLSRIQERVSQRRWQHLNEVIVTFGPVQPRIKAGVAVAIVRDCLGALAALHREGIVHGDIKPANIMLKRTGISKIIDLGSAFELSDPPKTRACTPSYAAPEVLDGQMSTPQSDLASMGYVLLELLAGRPLFHGITEYSKLVEAKRSIHKRLKEFLPEELTGNELLMHFCLGMVAPDPGQRFPNAEAAELLDDGAAAFHRQLVKGDLASEYGNDIRIWVEELLDLPATDDEITKDMSDVINDSNESFE